MKFFKSAIIIFLLGISLITGRQVFAANSAPVLDASKSPTMAPVSEDAGAPTGPVGTLVSNLVDSVIPSGQVDNVSDPDGGSLGIAITSVDTADVTCYYSLDSGATWSAVGAVSNTSARLLLANSSNRIYCQPQPNSNGTFPAVITFRAWDATAGVDGGMGDASTTGGTTAFSNATDTIAMTVIAVNDAPTATNLSAAESYTANTPLNLIDIVVSDIDSATLTVTLTLSDVAAGSLSTGTSGTVTSTYNGGTGIWTASGPIANLNVLLAGLTFTPANGYTSNFTIATSVSDGVAAPVTGAKAMTAIVPNIAPVAVDDSYSMTQNASTTSMAVLANDSDANGDALTITSVTPDTGTIGTMQITDNNTMLHYYPANGFCGTESFHYQISDGNGGTASAKVTWEVICPTPPAINSVTPNNGAVNQSLTTPIVINFSIPIVPVPTLGFEYLVEVCNSSCVPYPYSQISSEWTNNNQTLTLTPLHSLDPGTRYQVTIKHAYDLSNFTSDIVAPYTWSFTTLTPAGVSSGMGTPWTPVTQPTATTSKIPYTFPRTLKLGMKGDDVVILQKFLKVTPVASKNFGLKTKFAVMTYQKNHGLVADGILGAKSRAAIELELNK